MRNLTLLTLAALGLVVTSCEKPASSNTGWELNNKDYSATEKRTEVAKYGQETAPGLVFIPGGTFEMGNRSQDVMYLWDNQSTSKEVQSFFMDECEVTNLNYREYINWMKKIYQENYPNMVKAAMPDKDVWREELEYNENLRNYYFTSPGFDDYPVVGVSWEQAVDYAAWRTDRVNEKVLIDRGILNVKDGALVNQDDATFFTTEGYLNGKDIYSPEVINDKNLPVNYAADSASEGGRNVQREDGIFYPNFDLPTEMQWEFAAIAQVGGKLHPDDNRVVKSKIYTWEGPSYVFRHDQGKDMGKFLVNFKRGPGDYSGLAGSKEDGATYTAQVDKEMPNAYGLYNMAGNVSEWVKDVYRPMSSADISDLNGFRGNVFTSDSLNASNDPVINDSTGRIIQIEEDAKKLSSRSNYQVANAIDYEDGDSLSRAQGQGGVDMYSPENTFVNNEARVYKGGSWKDMAWWMSPGARRYLNQDESLSTLGFRLSMPCIGAKCGGEETNSGNDFKGNKTKWHD